MQLNKIYNENCLDTMDLMNDNFLNLTVTSPPYDDLRTYNGFHFDFESIAKELYRVTKPGGVVVWVVGDQVINGSETGTSFKQALYFMQCGFRLHDTMIYEKNSTSFPAAKGSNRYSQIFEYMFILSKGKPATVNLIADKPNRWEGWVAFGKPKQRQRTGELKTITKKPVPAFSPRNNIWRYSTGKNYSTKDTIAFQHPAIFPEKLAEDHILTWSNPGDIVYDPCSGSGTTAKMAFMAGRKYIGSELSAEYCAIAEERLFNCMIN